MEHKPVLLNEVIEFFDYLKDSKKVIADFTVGGGGHSYAILKKYPDVEIVAFDKDKSALEFARNRLKEFSKRITFFHSDYSQFDKYIDFKLDGAILDLGISSFQIDNEERGFSFSSNAKLDMRMDKRQKLSAYEVVNSYDGKMLSDIFYKYGEIKKNKRVVNAILKYRANKPIETCKELSEIIEQNYFTKKKKINPSTKFFQALRIYINNEIEALSTFLSKIFDYLHKGSRLQIISFHSLEDRVVKKVFKYEELDCICPKNLMICNCNKISRVKVLTRKPITPTKEEIDKNKRSRSAKLRVAEII